MNEEKAGKTVNNLTDAELRRDALHLSSQVIPEGQLSSTGLYNNGIKKTAKELIDDAEIIFKYLKGS